MNKIFETAMQFAIEQQTLISRLDIQFNFETQEHTGYLMLVNGKEYRITSHGWMRINP